ncbi:MAG TPA: glycosyl transferase family protein [Geminicoccaceae bacterium]|nr:glycosyl transferase family protein [Geminicoccus sp.]HMU50645.1 glycosyl transferase family protein [Geminicoccaceae bacterium]
MTARADRFRDCLRIVARGPTLSRPLDAAEAEEAFGLILDGAASPMQVGAFLLVLRQRGETSAEITGMVRAAQTRRFLVDLPAADLDWPSYADAHRQLPYFLLAAKLVAEAGVRVLMHGGAGAGEAATRHGLAALGVPVASSARQAAAQLAAAGLAYLSLESLCPPLAELFALKPVLGVRTAVNTVARELNPSGAPAQIQGVFHPPYIPLHIATQQALGQQRALTFKGGGGEAQRNPDKPCRSVVLVDGAAGDLIWPHLAAPGWPWRGETLDVSRLGGLWRGEWHEPAPVAAVIGTAAMALWLAGRAPDPDTADQLAAVLWDERDRALPIAA